MANLDPLCDACGKVRAEISDGIIGALICQNPACFEKAWDRAEWCEATPPCGHAALTRGYGGCDPAAIDYVIDHAGRRWTLEVALQALDRIAVIADEMGAATTYDQWDDLCVRLRVELGGGR